MKFVSIRHPENLSYTEEKVALSLRLFRQKKLPKSIEGFMVLTPLKHGLRCIFGSDLKAAWFLLMSAIGDKFGALWFRVSYPWKKKQYDADDAESDALENSDWN